MVWFKPAGYHFIARSFRADAGTGDALLAWCHRVVDVAGLEHGPGLVFPVGGLEPAFNSALAIAEDFWTGPLHAKWPVVGRCVLG
jgi:hypothetical protein